MNHLYALLAGFGVDLLLGDPRALFHPVQGMGWLILFLEKALRRIFPKTKQGELWAGAVMAALVVGLTGLFTWLSLWIAAQIHPILKWTLEVVICWQMLAVKSLRTESMKVVKALSCGTLKDGQRAVSMIVGRDTSELSEEEVLSAAVETVAENSADGILAPLIWAAFLGPVGGMCYKAVNTMDSMVGYQNERYLYFGRAAALLDDVCNFLPARISGLLMCVAACLAPGFDGREAFRIFLRDRKNHKSPNSAHTEAACAGAMGLRLGGTHSYFGVLVEKPTMGDGLRVIERQDVKRANDLTFFTAVLALLFFDVLPLLWLR